MGNFNFYGQQLNVSEAAENYIATRNQLKFRAQEETNMFRQEYLNIFANTSMENIRQQITLLGEKYMLNGAFFCTSILADKGVHTFDPARFITIYAGESMRKWHMCVDVILWKYYGLLCNPGREQSERSTDMSVRSRWYNIYSQPDAGISDWCSGEPLIAYNPNIYATQDFINAPNMKALMACPATLNILSSGLYNAIFSLHHGLTNALTANTNYPIEGPSDEKVLEAHKKYIALANEATLPEDALNKIIEIIKVFPYNMNYYDYILKHFGDEDNELPAVTEFFCGVNYTEIKELKFEQALLSYNLFSEKGLEASKTDALALAKELGIDSTSYINCFDELLQIYASYNLEVDGQSYDTIEAALAAKKELDELFEHIDGTMGNDSENIKSALKSLESYTFKSKDKYIDWLNDALNRSDIRFRSVKNILFSDQQEAQKAVEEDKEINEIMSRPVFSIAEINAKIEDISTKTTEIKNMYLEYLNIQINIWNQMDMFYAQHYNFYPDCRVTYTNVWYQAYELMEQGRLFGVNNQSFNAWFGNFNAAFMNVYNVNYTDVREAHKAYIVLLNHARSYEEYLRESNSGQFMDSLKSGFSSMWVKSYMDEYNYITNMGTLPLPRDTEADINQLISSHDMQLNNINTRLHSYDDLFGRMNSPLYSTDEVLNISHLLIPTQVVTRETTTAVFNSALKFVRLT